MKTNARNTNRGFTLIEMVGVLAVIAILAALLVPKIFAAINESRLNNAVVSVNTAKTAAMQYFGKYSKFGGIGGIALPAGAGTNWDASVLVPETLLERPFGPRIGDSAYVVLLPAGAAGAAVAAPTQGTLPTALSFSLTGSGTNDCAGAQYVVAATILGASADDAAQIKSRIDGNLTNNTGRVLLSTTNANNQTDIYVYLAHK